MVTVSFSKTRERKNFSKVSMLSLYEVFFASGEWTTIDIITKLHVLSRESEHSRSRDVVVTSKAGESILADALMAIVNERFGSKIRYSHCC